MKNCISTARWLDPNSIFVMLNETDAVEESTLRVPELIIDNGQDEEGNDLPDTVVPPSGPIVDWEEGYTCEYYAALEEYNSFDDRHEAWINCMVEGDVEICGIEPVQIPEPVLVPQTIGVFDPTYGLTPEELALYEENDENNQIDAIEFEYAGSTFSGSREAQNGMVNNKTKLEGKGDTKTLNWFDINHVLFKFNRDNYDDMLDIVEPITEDITDD